MSYGHITQLQRVCVKQADVAGTVLISSQDPFVPFSEGDTNAAGSRDSMRCVHSVSSMGDDILVGTRGGQLLVIDASAVHPARQQIVQLVRAAGIFRANAAHPQSKAGWAEQLRAAQEAKKIPKQENADGGWRINRVASNDPNSSEGEIVIPLCSRPVPSSPFSPVWQGQRVANSSQFVHDSLRMPLATQACLHIYLDGARSCFSRCSVCPTAGRSRCERVGRARA